MGRTAPRACRTAWASTPTGLISGTILPGDAADGPYFVTVSYTDAAGNSASQSFLWNVADPVTFKDPGDQIGRRGRYRLPADPAGDSVRARPPS